LSGRLILLGAGDFAREVIWLISEMAATQDWEFGGLLDDNPERAASILSSNGFEHRVLGNIVDYVPQPQDRFVCTIGNPKSKLAVTERIAGRGGQFVNLIHPAAAIGPGCILGHGIIVCRNAVITTNVTIGDHVHINLAATCGHDAVIGEGCTLSSHCDVTGHAVLEKGVFLGSHANVMPGVRVGAFATVAAGSIAFRNVKAGDTVIGVPAEVMFYAQHQEET
jgi:sugar O-acyltransferase (sialic acid O-acetyltransferase NeuD family)